MINTPQNITKLQDARREQKWIRSATTAGYSALARLFPIERRRSGGCGPRRRRRWPVAVASILMLLTLWGGTAKPAIAGSLDSLEDLLAKVPDIYGRERQNALRGLSRYRDIAKAKKQAAENELDARYRNATNAYGPESHEALAIKATYEWLQANDVPPRNPAAIHWMANYAESLTRQQKRVWTPLSQLAKNLAKAGLHDDVAELNDAFHRLEADRDPADNVLVGREFKGYRSTTDGKKLIPLRVKIVGGNDNNFSGTIAKDFMYRGHPVHGMSGRFVGTEVVLQTESVRAFGNKSDHAWTYNGCVIGTSIVGRYAGRDKKGKLKGGVFVLRTRR